MPVKTKSSAPIPFGVQKVSRFYDTNIRMTWDPACGIDPYESNTHYAEERAGADLGSYVESSQVIKYKNSNYKTFNLCHHFVKSLKFGKDSQFSLFKTVASHFEQPYNGCGLGNEITRDILAHDEYRFNVGGFYPNLTAEMGVLDYDIYLDQGSPLYEEKVRYLDGKAYETMLPKMDEGFSLPVFIFELIELKALFKNVIDFVVRNPDVIARLKKKPLKEASSQYLGTVYGWVPFVSDLEKIIYALYDSRRKIDAYIEGAGHPITLHFEKALNPETFRDASWFEPRGYNLEIDTRLDRNPDWRFASDLITKVLLDIKFKREIRDLKYHATMKFQYDLPCSRQLARMMARLDRWGVNLSVSDVWEIIPFSFVVDYFLGIGKYLQQWDEVNLPPARVIVFDFCRSFGYRYSDSLHSCGLLELRFPVNPDANHANEWSVSPFEGSCQYEVRTYIREPGFVYPVSQLLPNFRFPSGLQWLNMSALFHQRVNLRHGTSWFA